MITAIDTNILIDVIKGEEGAIDAISKAATEGQLIISEMIYAELCTGMSQKEVDHFLENSNILLFQSNLDSLALAGQLWKNFIKRSPKQGRILADFFIGAHAQIHSDRILTADRGFYRDYFKNLKIETVK
jgi:predicted nucleic acid-binding protein